MRKRIVVLGLMGQYPLGGMAWQVLHHVIGFRRLGYDCVYVENSGAPPYSPKVQSIVERPTENVRFLRDTFRRLDLAEQWAYWDSGGKKWYGMTGAKARDWLEQADAIVNVCGATRPDPVQKRRGCLVYIETDPILEQVRYQEGDPETRAFLDGHDLLCTYGVNIGRPDCVVPDAGLRWLKTHPPVVADLWESPPRPAGDWRTIATYRNRGKDVVIGGQTYYWSKHPNWPKVMDLPKRTKERLEVALVSPGAELRQEFLSHGWQVEDPVRVSHTAFVYRRYICGAKAEFSVEKDDLVRTKVGWFSDRSVCFLAAGRPCVLQDTGFGARVRTGAGLFPWSTAEEALDAIERVSRDYAAHAKAAREIARECFEASVLLPPICSAAGL
jgi:hypothetical protein